MARNFAQRHILDLEYTTRHRLDEAARPFCWEGAHHRLQQLAALLPQADGEVRARIVAEGQAILAEMRKHEEN